MYLKRHYDENRNVSGVELLRLPESGLQHFPPKTVNAGLQQGWITIEHTQQEGDLPAEGTLTLKTLNRGDLAFLIHHGPGRFCCHCGVKLPDDGSGQAAREHIEAEHAGEASPDDEHPAGYKCPNYYRCELI